MDLHAAAIASNTNRLAPQRLHSNLAGPSSGVEDLSLELLLALQEWVEWLRETAACRDEEVVMDGKVLSAFRSDEVDGVGGGRRLPSGGDEGM